MSQGRIQPGALGASALRQLFYLKFFAGENGINLCDGNHSCRKIEINTSIECVWRDISRYRVEISCQGKGGGHIPEWSWCALPPRLTDLWFCHCGARTFFVLVVLRARWEVEKLSESGCLILLFGPISERMRWRKVIAVCQNLIILIRIRIL